MLAKKLFRTIGHYKAQFISMIIMLMLGVGIFLGFNMEWYSIEKNVTRFFDESNFADYRIVSEEGFSEDDLEKIENLDGVEAATRYFSVNAQVSGDTSMLGVCVTTNPDVTGFCLMDGQEYDATSEDGFWLMDRYADEHDLKVGDELTLSFEGYHFSGTIRGLVEAGEQLICLQDEDQLMPDFKAYGYAYISPAFFKASIHEAMEEEYGSQMADELTDKAFEAIYPQINVISDTDKEEFSEEVKDVLDQTLMVLGKDETASYSEAMGEATEGKTMAAIMPVIFLLIAVLTMITTMQRIAANEKTQIGTLKSLGFKNRRIIWHYSCFSLLVAVLGAGLGIPLGYLVGYYIMNPNGMMGTYLVMPYWNLVYPWWTWPIIVGILLLVVAIGALCVRKMLSGTAADALRPYVPKKVKPMLIEKTPLWKLFTFAGKWNLRDAMRHKARTFVTVFGVVGCMILIVAAFGMNDTMHNYLDIFYTDVMRYASKVNLSSEISEEDAIALANDLEGDYSASVSVQVEGEPYSLDVYHLGEDMVYFLGEDNQIVDLSDDGAYVCLRMRDAFNLKVGDTITVSPYGTDEDYEIKIAGFQRSMSECISITEAYAKKLYCDDTRLTDSKAYSIGTIYTGTKKADIEDSKQISSIQSKAELEDTFTTFMEMLNTSIIALVVAAVVLSLVVLYNLGVMSYVERYRELATLKVVGFKNKRISHILISQNLWISIFGIIIGLPIGIWTYSTVLNALAGEYEFKMHSGFLTYTVAPVITFVVSLLVSLLISKKNKQIDMVSALKGQE